MNRKEKMKSKNKKLLQRTFWTQRNIIIIALFIIAVVASYFLFFKKFNEPQFVKEGEVIFLSKDTKLQLTKIDVEVAITPIEQSQGLMYRSEMDEGNGMFFIYEKMDMLSFWMKNTKIPLDILFIDNKGVINTIHKMTTPYSERSLPSKQKSQFVVEVNGGFCDRNGIQEGDLIEYMLEAK